MAPWIDVIGVDGNGKVSILDAMNVPGMPEGSLQMFSLTESWAQIGWGRRMLRVCRIIFGCVMASALLLMAGLAVYAIFSPIPLDQKCVYVFTGAFVTVLAWAVGCMFIWRGVHPAKLPETGGPLPPEPPSEGAPRLAPLRPHPPLFLFAHAALPTECDA